MLGKLNEMQITMEKMMLQIHTPGNERSSSKRQRVDDATSTPGKNDEHIVENFNAVPARSPRKIFNDQFKRTMGGYCSAMLSSKSAEEFIYDWYAKNLGTVDGNIVTLTVARWQSTVGHKQSTDNQGDAKNIMRLTEKLSSKAQLAVLKSVQPDAAKDSSYASWEMDMKATAKTLTKLIGDFITMKEGKVGNAKAYTVGALARRWKLLKYPAPTPEELLHLQGAASSKSSSSKARVC